MMQTIGLLVVLGFTAYAIYDKYTTENAYYKYTLKNQPAPNYYNIRSALLSKGLVS